MPRECVPERHVDRGERDADEPLGPEESESTGELLLDLDRSDRFALDEAFQIPDQFGRGLRRRRGVSEDEAVADDSVIAEDIGEDQR